MWVSAYQIMTMRLKGHLPKPGSPIEVGAQRGDGSAGDNRSRAPSRGRVDRTAEPVEGNELGEGSAPSAETNNF
jgi:hypothetical protein